MIGGFWPQLAWATEFVLESSGAVRSYRRRSKYLCAFLAFSALADIVAFCALRGFGRIAYGRVEWFAESAQYLLLSVLACQLVARMLEDYRRVAPYAGKVSLILGSAAGWIFYRAEGWQDRFLDTEICVSSLLCGMILVGWWMRKKPLSWPLSGVFAGIVIWIAGSGACAFAWKYWPQAGKWYAVPELASLILWNLSVWPKRKKIKPVELAEFRGGADQVRKPVASVRPPEPPGRWVM